MFRALYDWTLALAASPRAPWALGAVSFSESSFFPVPPDVMLAPMVLSKPQAAWRYATICTLLSVLGGLAGYAIGHLLYDSLGSGSSSSTATRAGSRRSAPATRSTATGSSS